MSIAVRYDLHLVLYRYCCKGRYSVNIHLKCLGKVSEFDHDWRVDTLNYGLRAIATLVEFMF